MKKRSKKRKKKEANKRWSIVRGVIFVISLAVFVFSAYKLYTIWNEYHENEKVYEEVKDLAPKKEVVDKETGEKRYVFNKQDFEKLLSTNSDFKAWIYVPGTLVDYPVVQSTDDDYYLHHNFYKEYNDGGAIFIAAENMTPFEERNTIIHGHHMNDGSMFASLAYFKQNGFLDTNNKIYITTGTKELEYQIFSVYYEKASQDPYHYEFPTDEDYINYLNGLKNKSLFNVDIEPFTADDKIITLSTCSYEVEDGRQLVHAKLIKETTYRDEE